MSQPNSSFSGVEENVFVTTSENVKPSKKEAKKSGGKPDTKKQEKSKKPETKTASKKSSEKAPSKPCMMCGEVHWMSECPELEDVKKFVKNKKKDENAVVTLADIDLAVEEFDYDDVV